MITTVTQDPPKGTPWGTADSVIKVAEGIYRIYTPSHGGYWLSDERHAVVLAAFGIQSTFAGGQWYEEDCDWSLVAIAFPEHFDKHLDAARAMLRSTRPEVYERFYCVVIPPGESYEKDRRAFMEKHREDFVVVSAHCNSDFQPVPYGFVLCHARIGGTGSKGRFLVRKDRYKARSKFGYVIQSDDAPVEET